MHLKVKPQERWRAYREVSGTSHSAASAARAVLAGWGVPATESPDFRKEPYDAPKADELQSLLTPIVSSGSTSYAHPSLQCLVFTESETRLAIATALKADTAVFLFDHKRRVGHLDEACAMLVTDAAFKAASRNGDRVSQMAVALGIIARKRKVQEVEAPSTLKSVALPASVIQQGQDEATVKDAKIAGETGPIPLPAPSHDAGELAKELSFKLDMILTELQKAPDAIRPTIYGAAETVYTCENRDKLAASSPGDPSGALGRLLLSMLAYEDTLRKLARLDPRKPVGRIEHSAITKALSTEESQAALELVSLDALGQYYWGRYFPPSFLPAVAALRTVEMVCDMRAEDAALIIGGRKPMEARKDIKQIQESIVSEETARVSKSDPDLGAEASKARARENVAFASKLIQNYIYYKENSKPGQGAVGLVHPVVEGLVDQMAALVENYGTAGPGRSGIGHAALSIVEQVRSKKAAVDSLNIQTIYSMPLACLLQSYSRPAVLAQAREMVASGTAIEMPAIDSDFDSELESIMAASPDVRTVMMKRTARALNFYVYALSDEKTRTSLWGQEKPGKKKVNRTVQGQEGQQMPFTAFPIEAEELPKMLQRAGVQVGNIASKAKIHESAEAIRDYDDSLRKLVMKIHEQFRVSSTLDVGGTRVHVCSPMQLDKYAVIPVYIEQKVGYPRLVLAYKSQSQDVWRRFAGYLAGLYWKGESEHLQTLDWRIQKALDLTYESNPHVPIMKSGAPMDLKDLSLGILGSNEANRAISASLIPQSEMAIQGEMVSGQKEFDLSDRSNGPERILDYWWGGDMEGAYGRYVNVIALSRNKQNIYCLAVTEDGIYLKSMQDAADGRINMVGAPKRGIKVAENDKWVFSPIIEYDSQSKGVIKNGNKDAKVLDTLAFRNNRVRIIGTHETPSSPFFEFSNGMEGICRLMREGSLDMVRDRLDTMIAKGILPLSSEFPEDPSSTEVRADFERRMATLRQAFGDYMDGRLDPATEQGRQRISGFMLTGRDLATFKRYKIYLDAYMGRSDGEAGSGMNHQLESMLENGVLERKLRFMAERWAKDMNKGTMQMESVESG